MPNPIKKANKAAKKSNKYQTKTSKKTQSLNLYKFLTVDVVDM